MSIFACIMLVFCSYNTHMCIYVFLYVYICVYIMQLRDLAAKKIQAKYKHTHTCNTHIYTYNTKIWTDTTVCICKYMFIYARIFLYLHVFCAFYSFHNKPHIGTYNSVCICMYDVYMCICVCIRTSFCIGLYVSVSVCMCMHLLVSHTWILVLNSLLL